MGVADDGRILRLTKDLRQRHSGNHAALEQVTQYISRTHRGQLVAVAHQNKTASGLQSSQQRRHQLQIHHAHLVHDDSIAHERIFFIFAEGDLSAEFVVAHTEAAVDGLCLTAAELTHPLGGAARGSQQLHRKPHPFKEGHDTANSGGLTCTGAAGQHQHTLLRGQRHGAALQGRIGHTLRRLNFIDDLACIHPVLPLLGAGAPKACGHIDLRLVHVSKIAALHIGDVAANDASLLAQVIHGLFHRLGTHINELCRCRHQLVAGQEHMAVAHIVAQLIQYRRFHTAGVLPVESHRDGDLIGGGEFHAKPLVGKEIGVIPQLRQRLFPVGAHQGHSHGDRQLVAAQKLRHALETRQGAKGGGYLGGLFRGHTLDHTEAFRFFLDHAEGVGTKALHQTGGGGRAHALENTGGEIGHDLLFILGQTAIHRLGGKLWAIGGVLHPCAGNGHALAGSGKGDAAHHRHQLTQIGQQ